MSEPILSATELSLSYGHSPLIDSSSLAINAGDKAGLVGRNGCGKSSFLRILAGVEQPDSGHIARRQGLVIGYLPQEFHLDEQRTVEENIREGAADLLDAIARFEGGDFSGEQEQERLQARIDHADGWNLETRITTLMRQLGTPPGDRPIANLSGGEKRRVGLARALVAQPDLLILDEPTNHLDTVSIEWLEEYLATFPGACLFVTHDRYFLDRISTRIIELSDGKFYSHEGNYSDYLATKTERQAAAQATEEKRQRFLKREVEWVRAGVQARRTKQQSRLDNYYTVKAQKAPDEELTMELIVPPAPDLGNIVVELDEVTSYIENRPLFVGLDLHFKAGECVGVVGPNGAGKTTLLRVIMGDLEPTGGSVKIGKRTEFNYADQSRLQIDDEKSIFEEVAEGKEMMQFGRETIPVRGYLKRFLFSDDRIKGKIGLLSGGEKNRVLLAKILKRGGNFLILDEPTNDLDLQSLRVLEEALISFTGTSVVVSHDRYFLDRVCDRVIVFEGEGLVTVNEGNYSYYREKRRQREAPRSSSRPSVPKSRPASPEKESAPPKLKWKEERELESMEETILEAEETLAEVEAKLANPRFFVDEPEEAAALANGLEKRKAAIQELYDRWAQLESIKTNWEEWKQKNG